MNPYKNNRVVIDVWGTTNTRFVVYVDDTDQPLFRRNIVCDSFAHAKAHADQLASWLSIPIVITGGATAASLKWGLSQKKEADQRAKEMSKPQPPPSHNSHPPVWDLVVADMQERDKTGRAKYGTPLQPHNGRDVLTDAYQEALDLAVYLRQAIYERDNK